MGIPSDNKNQVNRTREEPDPAAFSPKPEFNEKAKDGLRGKDKSQGDLRQDEANNGAVNPE